MDDQIKFDKAFDDMAEQVAVMNRECNRLQAALDRAEADKAAAVMAERERCAELAEELGLVEELGEYAVTGYEICDRIRAITTPPAPLASPEVQALVEAAQGVSLSDPTWLQLAALRTALATFTGAKP